MGVLEQIQDRIAGFAGYQTGEGRRLADEQIRAYVGERLAALPAAALDSLQPGQRDLYDRVLLRCEFMNQRVFKDFEQRPTPGRVDAILQADARLLAAAGLLAESGEAGPALSEVEAAFEQRDAAMNAE